MGYKQARFFVKDGSNADGSPKIIGTAIPFLLEDEEVNNISLALTPNESEREYKADNRVVKDKVLNGYDGTVAYYGMDKSAMVNLSAFRVDSNNHLVLKSSTSGNPSVVLFARGQSEKGKKYIIWLYDVEFSTPAFNMDQPEDNPKSSSLSFFASKISYGGEDVIGILIYEGEAGYIAEGTEPTTADLVMPASAS